MIVYIHNFIDNNSKKEYTYINYFHTIIVGGTAMIEATNSGGGVTFRWLADGRGEL